MSDYMQDFIELKCREERNIMNHEEYRAKMGDKVRRVIDVLDKVFDDFCTECDKSFPVGERGDCDGSCPLIPFYRRGIYFAC
jgi:hypothetical protein